MYIVVCTFVWLSVNVGLKPTTVTLLKDLEVKAAVQRNEMSSCPVITNDDHTSLSFSADILSPPPHQMKPDCNVELERSGVVAPPLTARNAQNPTVERNTHRGSSEEMAVEGNTLVPRRAAEHSVTDTTAAVSNPDNTQSRRLSALRPDQLHRISYVQNVVDNTLPTGPTAAAPKRQNVDSQVRQSCKVDCGDEIGKAVACPSSADDDEDCDDDDDDDDDDNVDDDDDASHDAGAGDNLGYESSTSPCYEAVSAPASCLV